MKRKYPPEKLKSPIITHCKVCGEKKGKSISPTCKSCAMKEIRSRPADYTRREKQSQAQKGRRKTEEHKDKLSVAAFRAMDRGFNPTENFGPLGGGGHAPCRHFVKVNGAGMSPEMAEVFGA